MVCAEGTETVYFGLPIVSPGFGSQFWFRLDSGPWRSTLWYYTHGIDGWYLENGQWIKMPSDGSASINLVGNGRLVEGWEFRWFPSNGSTRWVDLGSCQTTSFFTGGIVFIPSG